MKDQQPNPAVPEPSKTCHPVLENLGAYIDEELRTHERSEVESHLDGCDHCRRRLWELQEDWQLIRGLPQLPESTTDDFFSEVSARIRGRRRLSGLLAGSFAAAAAALLCLYLVGTNNLEAPGPEDELLIEVLPAVESLHSEVDGEVDMEILNLLALSPEMFFEDLDSEGVNGFTEDESSYDDESLDELIDFLLDSEAEGQNL